MSFADTLFQAPLATLPFAQLVTAMVQLTVLGAVLMFFRPLLIGIARALVLVLRPRPTKDELAARRKRNAARTPAGTQPSQLLDSADVRAMGSRS